MNGSPELLEFYLVEATEYIDALDQLVGAANAPPDANALLATARALRGSSMMAKVEPIAELSLVLEQIAIRGRDPGFPWSPQLAAAMRACVDDLRFLVRGVRVWSDREQTRADSITAELRRFVPSDSRRPTPPTAEASAPVFVALQAAAIASDLDAFVAIPTSRRALDNAISRTRTLRGIAGIGDFPPLADVAEVVERTGRSLMPDAPLAPEEIELFHAAAALFRHAAVQLRASGRHMAPAEESERFARAAAALESPGPSTPPAIRIDQLFSPEVVPVVEPGSPAPPSAAERLHRELVARSEHLRSLVNEGRRAQDPVVASRVRRDLAAAIRDIEGLAARHGAHQLSAFFADAGEAPDLIAAEELDNLEAAARITEAAFPTLDELERRIAVLQRAATPGGSPPVTAPAVAAPTDAVAPAVAPVRRAATPTGRDLVQFLESGIQGLKSLDTQPLSPPADEPSEVVSMETLLFRGPSALSRAIEIRDEWRSRGGREDDSLREIFDLLDLARPE
jgi:chemotaxis protein histidine kinase CheA